MKKLQSALAVTALGISLGIGGLVADAAPAAASGEYARCTNGISTRDWTGKDPRGCTPSGTYWLYSKTGTPLMKISQTPRTSPLWAAINTGAAAAEKWCGDHPLSCGIATSAGVAILTSLI